MTMWMSRSFALAGIALLSACSGNYDGGTANQPSENSGPQNFANSAEFFNARVQPLLGYCATCHVPGGVADTTEGERMMLSADRAQDMDNLRSSWEAMERNNPVSRILLMASGQGDPHSGGSPWAQNSSAYRDVSVMLACFESPDQCMSRIAAAGAGVTEQPLALLGSAHGRSSAEKFCEGLDGNTPRPDSAELPTDPRTLIQPGVNSGRAVFFNAYWQECRDGQPESNQNPRTCGEYRAQRAEGLRMISGGFQADRGALMTAAQWNDQWQAWGLTARPDNFDEMYRLQTGAPLAPYDNPYPLPGEDPNASDGGSGQLPDGYVQLRDASGNWTGTIGALGCASCHATEIGTAADGEGLGGIFGAPNAASSDPRLQRGHSDPTTDFEMLEFVLRDWDSLDNAPNPAKYPATHYPSVQDSPAWWNMGYRPRRFFDGGLSADAVRLTLAAADGPVPTGASRRAYIDRYAQQAQSYLESLRSPSYPRDIDVALAEQGAILFHAKDLWREVGNANKPRPPGGNGSCASCHGAYSPRFVHDPNFLDDPAFEGIAAHITPIAVIGTDRVRLDQLTGIYQDVWETSFWSYPEGMPGYISPEQKTPEQERADDNLSLGRPIGRCSWRPGTQGYLAPPLYGVWASAPYFHNGSVATVEQVLDSTQRLPMWRRQLRTVGAVTGYDSTLNGYDFERLGWRHDAIECVQNSTDLFTSCNPTRDRRTIQEQFSQTGPAPVPSTQETRNIVNTRMLSNGNAGHEFTDVLTEQERAAIIEYLKTL